MASNIIIFLLVMLESMNRATLAQEVVKQCSGMQRTRQSACWSLVDSGLDLGFWVCWSSVEFKAQAEFLRSPLSSVVPGCMYLQESKPPGLL